jgi:hypothetical protein
MSVQLLPHTWPGDGHSHAMVEPVSVQLAPPGQTFPHAPQLLGSVDTSTHPPEHCVT